MESFLYSLGLCDACIFKVVTPYGRSYYLAVWRFKHLGEWSRSSPWGQSAGPNCIYVHLGRFPICISINKAWHLVAAWYFQYLGEWHGPHHKAIQLARRYSHEFAAKIRNKSEINKHYSNYLKNIPCLTTGDGKIIHFNKNLILWKHTKHCKNLKILCLTTENHKPLKI